MPSRGTKVPAGLARNKGRWGGVRGLSIQLRSQKQPLASAPLVLWRRTLSRESSQVFMNCVFGPNLLITKQKVRLANRVFTCLHLTWHCTSRLLVAAALALLASPSCPIGIRDRSSPPHVHYLPCDSVPSPLASLAPATCPTCAGIQDSSSPAYLHAGACRQPNPGTLDQEPRALNFNVAGRRPMPGHPKTSARVFAVLNRPRAVSSAGSLRARLRMEPLCCHCPPVFKVWCRISVS